MISSEARCKFASKANNGHRGRTSVDCSHHVEDRDLLLLKACNFVSWKLVRLVVELIAMNQGGQILTAVIT